MGDLGLNSNLDEEDSSARMQRITLIRAFHRNSEAIDI